ncbi:MAG: small acid-soluble spore protein SspI [Bacilli bacterium]
MDVNIRSHIINNFRDDNVEVLRRAIEESIKEQDEIALPGMGVFLEIIWQGADEELKTKMLSIIEKRIKSN